MKICFHTLKPISLTNRNKLKKFLSTLSRKENTSIGELNYIFCSDDYLLKINQTYLQHNDYTDIITFDLTPANSSEITADIYISVDRIRENAKKYNTPQYKELHRVVFHGLLHLCGYKDKKKSDQTQMRLKEEEYLNKYFPASSKKRAQPK